MKKILTVCLCLVLVMALAVPALAAGVTFSMSASAKTLHHGQTVTLDVSVSSSQAATSYGMMLTYDSSVFEVVSHEWKLEEETTVKSFNNGFAFLFSDATAYSGKVGAVTLKVKDNAAIGTYTVTGNVSVKNGSTTVSASNVSVSVTVENHTNSAWASTGSTNHARTCSVCGITTTQAHSWDSGVVTKPATNQETGVKTYTCSVCNGTKTETIPVLTTVQWVDEDGNVFNVEQCYANVTVTATNVNLRSGPGTNYEKVGQATAGDQLTITGTVSNGGYVWGQFDGGWIVVKYTDFDTVINQDPESTKVYGITTVSTSMNIRGGAGTTYDVVGKLGVKARVEILEQKTVGSVTWARIPIGWVSMQYIALETTSSDTHVVSVCLDGVAFAAYETLTNALAVFQEGQHIVLTGDATQTATVSCDLTLDLNGCNLSNVTVGSGYSLNLIDSATDDYAGAYGTASVTGTVNGFAEHDGKTYLVVKQNGVYSAHCYECKLTHVSLKPSDDALGYKAQLLGDEIVQKNVMSFGFNLGVEGGASKTYTKSAGSDFDGAFTLRLKDIMATNGGEMSITGSAFVIFSQDDKTVTSDEHTNTMKDTIAAVNESFDSYSSTQQAAVKAYVTKYASKMKGWDIDKISG